MSFLKQKRVANSIVRRAQPVRSSHAPEASNTLARRACRRIVRVLAALFAILSLMLVFGVPWPFDTDSVSSLRSELDRHSPVFDWVAQAQQPTTLPESIAAEFNSELTENATEPVDNQEADSGSPRDFSLASGIDETEATLAPVPETNLFESQPVDHENATIPALESEARAYIAVAMEINNAIAAGVWTQANQQSASVYEADLDRELRDELTQRFIEATKEGALYAAAGLFRGEGDGATFR